MSGFSSWRWGDSLRPLERALQAGSIIAIPTESSYGLAVDPMSVEGVAAIYRLKRRHGDSPLPVVAADRSQLEALGCRFDDPLLDRLATLWPAPLSLLLPVSEQIPAAAGSGHLAARVPAHRRLRGLLASLDTALTATSANRAGEPPITRPTMLHDLFEGAREAVVVDDGPLAGGNPSTLVGVREGEVEVLRRGAVPTSALAECLGRTPERIFSAASVEILADESR